MSIMSEICAEQDLRIVHAAIRKAQNATDEKYPNEHERAIVREALAIVKEFCETWISE